MSEINIFEDSWGDDGDIKIVKLMWKITNVSEREDAILSPLFRTSAPDILGNWRIILDRKYKFGICTFSVRFYQENSAVKPTHIAVYFFDEKHDIARRHVCKFCENGCTGHFEENIDQKYLYLPDDELLTLGEIVIKVPSQNKSLAMCGPPPCQLVEDLGNLLSSKTLSDVTIAVGGAALRAHKAVLAARSAVFAAMFSNQMREKETSVVEVTDVDAEVFGAMLEFMYTGKEISQTSRAYDLLVAANKYQLHRLKALCEEALCDALSVDNVLESLTFAELHNTRRLKEQCISFIMEHKAEVLRTSSWNDLKRSQLSLVVEVLEKISLNE